MQVIKLCETPEFLRALCESFFFSFTVDSKVVTEKPGVQTAFLQTIGYSRKTEEELRLSA